jgi:hypothetical protein
MMGKSSLFQYLFRSIFLLKQASYLGVMLVIFFLLQFLVGCNRYNVSEESIQLIGTVEVMANSEKLMRHRDQFTKYEVCNQPPWAAAPLELLGGERHPILRFWPADQIQLSTHCYEQDGGIGAEIHGLFAGIIGKRPVWHRFELFINGERISKETFSVREDYSAVFKINPDGSLTPVGIFSVNWKPELEIGRQEVELMITQRDAGNFIYSWSFEIIK